MKYERPFKILPVPKDIWPDHPWRIQGRRRRVSNSLQEKISESEIDVYYKTRKTARKICRRLNMLHQKETTGSIDPKLMKHWNKEEITWTGSSFSSWFFGTCNLRNLKNEHSQPHDEHHCKGRRPV